jgi:hypothetical protein
VDLARGGGLLRTKEWVFIAVRRESTDHIAVEAELDLVL